MLYAIIYFILKYELLKKNANLYSNKLESNKISTLMDIVMEVENHLVQ